MENGRYFDHRMPSGVRLLAMAEPVHANEHGRLTAVAALAAFEETLLVAVHGGTEPGLLRAFAAANQAVRDANQLTVVDQRAYVGITAAAVDGGSVLIGCVPPGQVLIVQDGRLYGVPELASWQPDYVASGPVESEEPLGLRWSARPRFRWAVMGAGMGC